MTTITRRNHGRGHSYWFHKDGSSEGRSLPGVTTVTGKTIKQDWMESYATRTTAEYAIDNWAELSALPLSQRLARLRKATSRNTSKAAVRGTRVHKLAEQLAQGHEVEVPEELAAHVDSYTDFLNRVEPQPAAPLELVVANLTWWYCGTVDLIADLPAMVIGGEKIPPARWLLDLKSGNGVYGEAALQLCAYRHAEVFPAGDNDLRPVEWLRIERCGVVHVRADGWDLRPVETGPEVWQHFQLLRKLYDRIDDVKTWVGEAADPPPLMDG